MSYTAIETKRWELRRSKRTKDYNPNTVVGHTAIIFLTLFFNLLWFWADLNMLLSVNENESCVSEIMVEKGMWRQEDAWYWVFAQNQMPRVLLTKWGKQIVRSICIFYAHEHTYQALGWFCFHKTTILPTQTSSLFFPICCSGRVWQCD